MARAFPLQGRNEHERAPERALDDARYPWGDPGDVAEPAA
jgi:hypothetical protein